MRSQEEIDNELKICKERVQACIDISDPVGRIINEVRVKQLEWVLNEQEGERS